MRQTYILWRDLKGVQVGITVIRERGNGDGCICNRSIMWVDSSASRVLAQ